ncbi:MAG TPA: hypothetical protein VIW68_09305 [Candidatus Sulfotelmatobacter sp.]
MEKHLSAEGAENGGEMAEKGVPMAPPRMLQDIDLQLTACRS